MLNIKADGQAELRLLDLLYPATPSTLPNHLDRERVPAAIQQQLNELTFVVQEQQRQLEQARAAIADYQQMVMSLGDPQTPLLPPAASTSKPRQYITGGLGQPPAITVNAQSAPATQQKRAMQTRSWPKRLTTTTFLLALFLLTTWGVFKYVAPPVSNWVFSLHQTSVKEKNASAKPTPVPQSNLSEDAPGSAASKAGTQPNALDF
jgi:hypothetical protein